MRIFNFPTTVSSVRINKLVTAFAAGVITLGLLLGAATAQAFTIEVDASGTNATAIRDIAVPAGISAATGVGKF